MDVHLCDPRYLRLQLFSQNFGGRRLLLLGTKMYRKDEHTGCLELSLSCCCLLSKEVIVWQLSLFLEFCLPLCKSDRFAKILQAPPLPHNSHTSTLNFSPCLNKLVVVPCLVKPSRELENYLHNTSNAPAHRIYYTRRVCTIVMLPVLEDLLLFWRLEASSQLSDHTGSLYCF